MLFVKDIATRGVKTIPASANIEEAAVVMTNSNVGCLVVTEDGKPVGIITEGDVSRAVGRGHPPDKTAIKSLLFKPLITVTPDLRVEEAAKLMANANVKKLPVMEEGRLVGIITQTDIVASSFDLVTALKEMVRARYRPPDFQP
jgi:CBS domain-containing protein